MVCRQGLQLYAGCPGKPKGTSISSLKEAGFLALLASDGEAAVISAQEKLRNLLPYLWHSRLTEDFPFDMSFQCNRQLRTATPRV